MADLISIMRMGGCVDTYGRSFLHERDECCMVLICNYSVIAFEVQLSNGVTIRFNNDSFVASCGCELAAIKNITILGIVYEGNEMDFNAPPANSLRN